MTTLVNALSDSAAVGTAYRPCVRATAWPTPPSSSVWESGRVKSEPASAGGSNRLGGGRGQFPVTHTVEHPFHYGDNLRGCRGESGLIGFGDLIRIDACPGQHGGRVGQLIGKPGQRVG